MSVLSTFIPVTATKKEAIKTKNIARAAEEGDYLRTNLVQVLYIWYPINFWINFVSVLFDLSSEFNIIYLIFAKEIWLYIKLIDVLAQKINSNMLNTYEIIVIIFVVTDKANWIIFFKETFLVANVSFEVVLEILFLTLSNTKVDFLDWKFW